MLRKARFALALLAFLGSAVLAIVQMIRDGDWKWLFYGFAPSMTGAFLCFYAIKDSHEDTRALKDAISVEREERSRLRQDVRNMLAALDSIRRDFRATHDDMRQEIGRLEQALAVDEEALNV